MRRPASFFVSLAFVLGFSPFAQALDKGLYAIAEITFVGNQAVIDATRQVPLAGDLMQQLESASTSAYAEYDPETSLLTTFAPGKENVMRLDTETLAAFDGDTRIGDLVELTDDLVVVRMTELPDMIPFDFQIRFEKASLEDARIVASLNAIEEHEKALEQDRLAAAEALKASPSPGLRLSLPNTDFGVALPRAYSLKDMAEFDGGIVRYDFANADTSLADEFFLFLTPDEAQRDRVKTFLDNNITNWTVRFEDGVNRLGVDPFGEALIRAEKQVGDAWLVAFANSAAETTVIEWRGVLSTAALFDQVDAPTAADLFRDPVLLASYGGGLVLSENGADACQDALPALVDIGELADAKPALSSNLFSHPSFPSVDCEIGFENSDKGMRVAISLYPDFQSLGSIAIPEGANVLLQTEDMLIVGSDRNLKQIKALRRLTVDGLPALVQATTGSVGHALGFIAAAKALDTSALTIPAGWRRHIGAFRRVSLMVGAPGFYEYTTERDAFAKGILTADGDIIVEAIYDRIEAIPSAFILHDDAGLKGIITRTGEEILPIEHRTIAHHGDNRLTIYRTDGTRQVFDLASRRFLGEAYESIDFLKEEKLFIVKQGDARQIMSMEMEPEVEGKFEYLLHLSDGLFIVEQNDKAGLIDRTGAEILPKQFDRLWPHAKHRLISARTGRTSVYYDYDGRLITPKGAKAHYAPSAEAGHVTFSDRKGLYGVVSKTGNILIKPTYARMHQFSEGYIPAAKKTRGGVAYGLIDEDETVIIPFDYDNLSLVRDERLWAQKDGLWGLIEIDETQIADFEYNKIFRSREGQRHDTGEDARFMVALKGDRYGVVDHATGEVLIPFEYPDARPMQHELFKDGAWLRYPWDFKEN